MRCIVIPTYQDRLGVFAFDCLIIDTNPGRGVVLIMLKLIPRGLAKSFSENLNSLLRRPRADVLLYFYIG